MDFPKTGKFAPVTLSQMRSHGCSDLLMSCNSCHYCSAIRVGHLPDATPIKAAGDRMICTQCGHVGADATPLWDRSRAALQEALPAGCAQRAGDELDR